MIATALKSNLTFPGSSSELRLQPASPSRHIPLANEAANERVSDQFHVIAARYLKHSAHLRSDQTPGVQAGNAAVNNADSASGSVSGIASGSALTSSAGISTGAESKDPQWSSLILGSGIALEPVLRLMPGRMLSQMRHSLTSLALAASGSDQITLSAIAFKLRARCAFMLRRLEEGEVSCKLLDLPLLKAQGKSASAAQPVACAASHVSSIDPACAANTGCESSLFREVHTVSCQGEFTEGMDSMLSALPAVTTLDGAQYGAGRSGSLSAAESAGKANAAVDEAGGDAAQDNGRDAGHDAGHDTGHDAGHDAGHTGSRQFFAHNARMIVAAPDPAADCDCTVFPEPGHDAQYYSHLRGCLVHYGLQVKSASRLSGDLDQLCSVLTFIHSLTGLDADSATVSAIMGFADTADTALTEETPVTSDTALTQDYPVISGTDAPAVTSVTSVITAGSSCTGLDGSPTYGKSSHDGSCAGVANCCSAAASGNGGQYCSEGSGITSGHKGALSHIREAMVVHVLRKLESWRTTCRTGEAMTALMLVEQELGTAQINARARMSAVRAHGMIGDLMGLDLPDELLTFLEAPAHDKGSSGVSAVRAVGTMEYGSAMSGRTELNAHELEHKRKCECGHEHERNGDKERKTERETELGKNAQPVNEVITGWDCTWAGSMQIKEVLSLIPRDSMLARAFFDPAAHGCVRLKAHIRDSLKGKGVGTLRKLIIDTIIDLCDRAAALIENTAEQLRWRGSGALLNVRSIQSDDLDEMVELDMRRARILALSAEAACCSHDYALRHTVDNGMGSLQHSEQERRLQTDYEQRRSRLLKLMHSELSQRYLRHLSSMGITPRSDSAQHRQCMALSQRALYALQTLPANSTVGRFHALIILCHYLEQHARNNGELIRSCVSLAKIPVPQVKDHQARPQRQSATDSQHQSQRPSQRQHQHQPLQPQMLQPKMQLQLHNRPVQPVAQSSSIHNSFYRASACYQQAYTAQTSAGTAFN